jgi:hypothetical protein
VTDLFGNNGRCQEPECGKPKGRGRPRKGWVKIEPEGEEGAWFCGWECVIRYAMDRGGI